jgi:hypothetical protein
MDSTKTRKIRGYLLWIVKSLDIIPNQPLLLADDRFYCKRHHGTRKLRYMTEQPRITKFFAPHAYSTTSTEPRLKNIKKSNRNRSTQPLTTQVFQEQDAHNLPSARSTSTQQLLTNFLKERASNTKSNCTTTPSPLPSTTEYRIKGPGRVSPLLLAKQESCRTENLYNLFTIHSSLMVRGGRILAKRCERQQDGRSAYLAGSQVSVQGSGYLHSSCPKLSYRTGSLKGLFNMFM